MEGDIILTSDEKRPSRVLEFLKKYTIIIIDITLVAVAICIVAIRSLKSSTLEILVAPTSATVKINGKTYPSSGSFDFFPGDYDIEISAEGYETKNLTLNLEQDSIQKLYTYLTGVNNDFSLYFSSPNDMEILQLVGDDSSQAFLELYSIIDILPLHYQAGDTDPMNYKNFSISYETEDCKERPFCLIIEDTFEGNYDLALSLLREYGYDPSDYEIIYNYTCEKGDTAKCYRI